MLQQRLNVKLSHRQVLTPGLVQMVGVLALNNLELKDMINNELVENPVLEEIDQAGETLDERSSREGDRERTAEELASDGESAKSDPFDEIDFGSYFKDYLDPGFRAPSTFEEYDKPSFEQFLTTPSTLADHLRWQIGAMPLSEPLRATLELLIGNLNEDGYLTATDTELLAAGEPEFWSRAEEGRPLLEAASARSGGPGSARSAGLPPAPDRRAARRGAETFGGGGRGRARIMGSG